MADNEINVEYDTDGVPSELPSGDNVNGFSEELSNYLYPKLTTIENYDENLVTEFTPNQIQEYGLETNSNQDIDISTTRKLIKYLKAYSKKIVSGLTNRVEELENGKLNITDYIVDRGLSETSNNPVANSVLYRELHDIRMAIGQCVGLEHAHNIEDIFGLGDALSGLGNSLNYKLDETEFTNHTNADNPHNITLEKLGVNDIEKTDTPSTVIGRSIKLTDGKPYCRKYGKMIFLNFNGTLKVQLGDGVTLFTLSEEFRPKRQVYCTVYRVGTGKTGTCRIGTDGKVWFGATLPKDETLRICECYMGK